MLVEKIILIVLDSVGVGELPDAAAFDDTGANTLLHVAEAYGGLNLPTLQRLGLGNIIAVPGVGPAEFPTASYGRMAERSPGKDTVTGHWELAGLISKVRFPSFPNGFPQEVIDEFEAKAGVGTLYNRPASGTVVIEQLGPEHMKTGKVIIYTSADSVFQIAAHEEIVPLESLYEMCHIARSILDKHRVARVIARPFVGVPGSFTRTYGRRDFCMEPPSQTLLERLREVGFPVLGVGKIKDIFAGRGVSKSVHTEGNRDAMEKTIVLNRSVGRGLIFVNLVDFDMVYGHRRNAEGYARALEETDRLLHVLVGELDDKTALFITGDHGCDPTHTRHTDHTREYVPVLAKIPGVPVGKDLGTRSTFADLAATVGQLLAVELDLPGEPFFREH